MTNKIVCSNTTVVDKINKILTHLLRCNGTGSIFSKYIKPDSYFSDLSFGISKKISGNIPSATFPKCYFYFELSYNVL